MSSNRLRGKTVFITGASAGIGKSCATQFAEAGANLILTARRVDAIQALKAELESQSQNKITIHAAPLDVRNRDQVFKVLRELPEALRRVDVLVNNAGLVLGVDHVADVPPENVDIMFDTNVKGLLNVTQAVLPIMKERNEGHIINIGSIAGKQVYPGGGIYCATKHAVNAITEALRHETNHTPIRVSEICPGLVETEFSIVRFGGDKERAGKVYQGVKPLTADDVAEVVVFTAGRPAHVNVADTVIFANAQSYVTDIKGVARAA